MWIKIIGCIVTMAVLLNSGCGGPTPVTHGAAALSGWTTDRVTKDGNEIVGMLDPTKRWKIATARLAGHDFLAVVDTRTGWRVDSGTVDGDDSMVIKLNEDERLCLNRTAAGVTIGLDSAKANGRIFSYDSVGRLGAPDATYTGRVNFDADLPVAWYDFNADGQFDAKYEAGKKRSIRCAGGWLTVSAIRLPENWAKDEKGAEYSFDQKKGVWIQRQ